MAPAAKSHTVDQKSSEKAVIASLMTQKSDPVLFEEDLVEMQMLCTTAGAEVVASIVQKRERPEASTFLGAGKLEEIAALMKETGAQTLIIDAELSPGQVRNIEELIAGKVIDRAQLILDIFARHAKSNEAKIQVELAQLNTLYPRLTRAWTHFSQQAGGIGTRGPGEKQLEVDRRLVQTAIAELKRKLKKIDSSRTTQRKSRGDTFKIALVGYTNAGKSSILNGLSKAQALVANKLFATLDTATRRVFVPEAGEVIVSDTVGFLRKLPHHLVASFKSTLEVVSDAHLLLIILDASSPWIEQQLETVTTVLASLDAGNIRRQLVLNKSDLATDPFTRKKLALAYPDALFVSALNKEDMSTVKTKIAEIVRDFRTEQAKADIIAQQTNLLRHDD